MELHQVKNQSDLARNIESNSIVNKNTKEFEKYITRRQMRSKSMSFSKSILFLFVIIISYSC